MELAIFLGLGSIGYCIWLAAKEIGDALRNRTINLNVSGLRVNVVSGTDRGGVAGEDQ